MSTLTLTGSAAAAPAGFQAPLNYTAVINSTQIIATSQLSRVWEVDPLLKTVQVEAVLYGGVALLNVEPLLGDEAFQRLGYWPVTPVIVNKFGVYTLQQLFDGINWTIEDWEVFIVGENPDYTLTNRGAAPFSVGSLSVTSGLEVLQFRHSLKNEVIVVKDGLKVKQWNGVSWVEFATMPEKALFNQKVFIIEDQEQIFMYLAKLLGLVYQQMKEINVYLLRVRDPDLCPDQFLGSLAESLGARVTAGMDNFSIREVARTFPETTKMRGTLSSVKTILSSYGFKGKYYQVWKNITPDPPVFEEFPMGWFIIPTENYRLTRFLSLHLARRDGSPFVGDFDSQEIKDLLQALDRSVTPSFSYLMFIVLDHEVSKDRVRIRDSVQVTEL